MRVTSLAYHMGNMKKIKIANKQQEDMLHFKKD